MPRDNSQMVSAEDILAKMRAGVKETYEIRMREQVFAVRILAMDEIAAIRREAIKHQLSLGGDDTDKNVYIQKATLTKATTLSKATPSMLSERLMGMLSLDEVKYLYEEYIRVMDAVNPAIEHMDPAEFRALVDALKKNILGSRDCSLLQLRAICSAFQELIQNPGTQNSHQVS